MMKSAINAYLVAGKGIVFSQDTTSSNTSLRLENNYFLLSENNLINYSTYYNNIITSLIP